MNLPLTVDQSPPPIPRVRLVGGIFFAALGVLMTLSNLDLVDAHRFLRYWPVVLIAIGLLKLTERADRVMGVIALVAGILLLAGNAHWMWFSVRNLWPLLLVVAGAWIAAGALGWRTAAAGATPRPNVWAILSTRKIVNDTRDYAGGRIAIFLGGCDLDLTAADIQDGLAIIEAAVMWGGLTIRVPSDWEVIGEVTPIMAGIDIRTTGARGGRKLIVRGLTFMGGMEIKSAPARTI